MSDLTEPRMTAERAKELLKDIGYYISSGDKGTWCAFDPETVSTRFRAEELRAIVFLMEQIQCR